MKDVVYHPKVPSEVRNIIEYYEGISVPLADEFWEELASAIQYAQEYPERHHWDASGRRRSNLKRFPYHFLFRIFDPHIRMTVIRHHSRDPRFGSRRA